MIAREQLVTEVVQAFPSIESDIRDDTWAGLLHLEVSSFARYTQKQLDCGNRVELRRCFELALRFLLEGDDAVRNAMYASYLEHLNLKDEQTTRSWALEEMPDPLKKGYTSIWGSK